MVLTRRNSEDCHNSVYHWPFAPCQRHSGWLPDRRRSPGDLLPPGDRVVQAEIPDRRDTSADQIGHQMMNSLVLGQIDQDDPVDQQPAGVDRNVGSQSMYDGTTSRSCQVHISLSTKVTAIEARIASGEATTSRIPPTSCRSTSMS